MISHKNFKDYPDKSLFVQGRQTLRHAEDTELTLIIIYAW